MTTGQLLTRFGINEKAARLYLALLALGTAKVVQVAEQAGVKRPTAYVLLSALREQGLVSEQLKGRERLFTATKPEALKERLAQNLREFEAALPQLVELTQQQAGRPAVEVLEGRSAIIECYFDLLTQPGELCFLSDVDTLTTEFSEFLTEFNQRIRNLKKPSRELVGNSFVGRRYARGTKRDAPLRSARLLDTPIANDTAIVGDTVLIVSFQANNFFAVKLTNPQIAQSYRGLFEQLWRSSKIVS